jgi:ethanolamine utilization protein EutN
MQLARVIGNVVATRKDPGLAAATLLVLQPLSPAREPVGTPLVAVDSVGAGVTEEVFFVRGREASLPFLPRRVPADACVIGICDHWNAAGADRSADGAPPPGASRQE